MKALIVPALHVLGAAQSPDDEIPIINNKGGFFSPELETTKITYLTEECQSYETLPDQRLICMERNILLRESCRSYVKAEDWGSTYYFNEIDFYSPWAKYASFLTYGGSTLLAIWKDNRASGEDFEVSLIYETFYKYGEFWINYWPFVLGLVVSYVIGAWILFDLLCFCTCSCCRKCWGKMCCKKCFHDRDRVIPFWDLANWKVTLLEVVNYLYHILIGLGFIPMFWYVIQLSKPETMGRIACTMTTITFDALLGDTSGALHYQQVLSNIGSLGQEWVAYSPNDNHSSTVNSVTGGSYPYEINCASPGFFVKTPDPKCEYATADTTCSLTSEDDFFLDRTTEDWLSGDDPNHPLYKAEIDISIAGGRGILLPLVYPIGDSGVTQPESQTYGCAWNSRTGLDAILPYYKKYAWGRLTRNIGAYTTYDPGSPDQSSAFKNKNKVNFPSTYSFNGAPFACHSEINAEIDTTGKAYTTAESGCVAIRALKNDAVLHPTRPGESHVPSIHPANMDGSRFDADTATIVKIDGTPFQGDTDNHFSMRPDNYFWRINDYYHAADGMYLPNDTDKVQMLTPNALDHILNKGVIEGPSIPTLSAISGYTDLTDTYLPEWSNLLMRAHTLTEYAVFKDPTGATPPEFLKDNTMMKWIGDNYLCDSTSSTDCRSVPRYYGKYNSSDSTFVELIGDQEKNSFHNADFNVKSFDNRSLDRDSTATIYSFFEDLLHKGSTKGKHLLTRKGLWSRTGLPTVNGFIDYFRSYHTNATDKAGDQKLYNPSAMMDHNELTINGTTFPDDYIPSLSDLDDETKIVSEFFRLKFLGWLVTETSQEQMPFMYFHKPNLVIDIIMDMLAGELTRDSVANNILDIYDMIAYNLSDILDIMQVMADGLMYWSDTVEDADEIYVVHYWASLGVCLSCILFFLLWLGSTILFTYLAIRKCMLSDPNQKDKGHIYRGMCYLLFTQAMVWWLIMTLTAVVAPTAGELAKLCETETIISISNGDTDDIWFPDKDLMILSKVSVKNCLDKGTDFLETDFGDDAKTPGDEASALMTEFKKNVTDFMGYMNDYYSNPEFTEYDKWAVPIPSLAQAYPRPGVMGVPALIGLSDSISSIGNDIDNAKKAISNEMDTVIAAFPRGLVDVNRDHPVMFEAGTGIALDYPLMYDEIQVENVGISPFDPVLSVVSKELALVNIKYNSAPLKIDDNGVEVNDMLVGHLLHWNGHARNNVSRNPIWFGGQPSSDWEDTISCAGGTSTDTGAGDDLYCRVGVSSTATNDATYKRQYRQAWETLDTSSSPKTVRLDIDLPELGELNGQTEIPGWAQAVQNWLDNLYGGAEEARLHPNDRKDFCSLGGDYMDICVTTLNFNTQKRVPVAGRCKTDQRLFETFDDDTHCAKWTADDAVIDYENQFICISPLRTTFNNDGDTFNSSDIDPALLETSPLMKLWSGLVPGMLHLGGGRVGRFVDPTCPLFCSDDILTGAVEFGISNNEDDMDNLWFGTPSWYGEKKPLLTAFKPPVYSNAAGVKVSPMRFLKDYRKCILHDEKDYPITSDTQNVSINTDDLKSFSDNQKQFLRFLADIEHIQTLANAAFDYLAQQNNSGMYDRNIRRMNIERDLERLPVRADLDKSNEEIKDEMLANIDELFSRAKITNEILGCQEAQTTWSIVQREVCQVPTGFLAANGWLGFLLSWLFFAFAIFAFKQFHYWLNAYHLEPGDGDNILVHAYYGDLPGVLKCIRSNPDCVAEVDYNYNNAIHMAAFANKYHIVQYLAENLSQTILSNGEKYDLINHVNNASYTPLHVAAYEGFIDIVRLLIENGAYPDMRDEFGDTPICSMVRAGNIEMVELLLIMGADIAKPTGAKVFAYEIAELRGDDQMVEILEKHRKFSTYKHLRDQPFSDDIMFSKRLSTQTMMSSTSSDDSSSSSPVQATPAPVALKKKQTTSSDSSSSAAAASSSSSSSSAAETTSSSSDDTTSSSSSK